MFGFVLFEANTVPVLKRERERERETNVLLSDDVNCSGTYSVFVEECICSGRW
jgi:hypothetical protein